MAGAFDPSAQAAQRASLAAFGRPARYTCQGHAPVDVLVTFRASSLRHDASGVPVHSSAPTLGVRTADLPARPRQQVDLVTVDGVDYVVAELLPDGLGWSHMLLQVGGRVD